MKIGRLFTIIIVLIFGGLASKAQEVKLNPLFPERNQLLTVTFTPAAGSEGIGPQDTAVTLVFTFSNLYDLPNRIRMVKRNGSWQTSFRVSRYATHATFVLESGEKVQKPAPDKHYVLAIYDNGKRIRNGYTYESSSLATQMKKDPRVPAMQAALLEKELELYPDNYEARVRLLNNRMSGAEGKEKEDFLNQANKVIADKFYSNPTNQGNMNMVTMGYLIMGENSRVDSIRDVVRKRYPDSAIGIELVTDFIAKDKDTTGQIALFEKELKKETFKNTMDYTGMHSHLFELYAQRKDSAKALYHARFMARNEESPYKASGLKKIAQTLLDNDLSLDSARYYAERSLQMAEQFPVGLIRYFPETGYIFPYADDNTRQAVYNKAKGNLLSMLGLISMKQGKIKDASEKMDLAVKKSTDKETLDNVATFYTSTKQTAKLEELRIMRRNEMMAKVLKQQIRKPCPSLSAFTDLKGNKIVIDSFKNKVLVIDFWATWCVPCMQEMPYVQKVYDKYINNPDVAFLIVNSASRNTLADAQNWTGNKKYTFPVYYNTDRSVGDKFGFNVIPATYIIDRNGDIRFSNIGFEGAEVEARLDLQVETLLKK